jgi:hypothetical protein
MIETRVVPGWFRGGSGTAERGRFPECGSGGSRTPPKGGRGATLGNHPRALGHGS